MSVVVVLSNVYCHLLMRVPMGGKCGKAAVIGNLYSIRSGDWLPRQAFIHSLSFYLFFG